MTLHITSEKTSLPQVLTYTYTPTKCVCAYDKLNTYDIYGQRHHQYSHSILCLK